MFKITFADRLLKERVEDPQKHYPDEVCLELPPFLEALEKSGQVSGADYFLGNISRISANTFELHYVVDVNAKTVKIIELNVKSLDLLKERFSLEDSWDDDDVVDILPQCDPPKKLIKALKLIYNGVTDAYQLGYDLGHRGKKERYISRHGQYTRQALEALKLVESVKQGRKKVPELTDRGRQIAVSSDPQFQEKLLTIAMLNYPPLWKVINAITDGDGEFEDSTIQKIAFPEELREANTCPRRTQTLKSWIRWISSTSGIPIRLPGGTKQLTLSLYE
ncbi:MAG: hypothetical protein AAFY17_07035 [Cyanobacteria bacterium J06642_11]